MKERMIMFIILICSLPGYAFAVITYDLAADWSDAINPNGVWSYNSAPGQLITNHVADWDPQAVVLSVRHSLLGQKVVGQMKIMFLCGLSE